MDLKKIEEEALRLSEDDRVLLIQSLSESLHEMDADVEKSWLDEAKQRWTEIQSGQVETIPHDQAMNQLYADLNETSLNSSPGSR